MKASQVLEQKRKKIEKILDDNPNAFDFLLTDVPDLIRKRTRLGKGVDENGGKLKPLLKRKGNEAYEKLRASSQLSGETTAKRSNLTASGQLLESILGERSGLTFRFFFKQQRKPGIDGRPTRATNSDIVLGQEAQGRRFFFLAKTEINGLSRKIRDEITQRIKNLFNN